MKLIVLAFVFNFILNCWPKTNIIFKLFNHFGRSKIICYIHEINGYFEYIL